MSGLGSAVALLTRIPVGSAVGDEVGSRSVKWIPFVGAAIGGVVAALYAGLIVLVPPLLAASLAVAVGVLITGAFHEDGLADAADGLVGGIDREESLRIMHDPTHGTYGILALVLTMVVRVGAVAAMAATQAVILVPLAHSLSRGGAIALMGLMPPAATDGLGAAHADAGLRRQVIIGTAVALLIGLLLVGWWTLAFLPVVAVPSLVVGGAARRKISGYTGDVLGAAQQVGEVLVLVLAVMLIEADLIALPWWA